MRAQIEQTTMGYHVALSASQDRFAQLLETFKSIIPRRCRHFMGKYWFVDLRSKRHVEKFVDAVQASGGQVQR